MADKSILEAWVLEALDELGGRAGVVDVCKVTWRRHEQDLRHAGNLFYTWQYDIRWAAQRLRDRGDLQAVDGARHGQWALPDRS